MQADDLNLLSPNEQTWQLRSAKKTVEIEPKHSRTDLLLQPSSSCCELRA